MNNLAWDATKFVYVFGAGKKPGRALSSWVGGGGGTLDRAGPGSGSRLKKLVSSGHPFAALVQCFGKNAKQGWRRVGGGMDGREDPDLGS